MPTFSRDKSLSLVEEVDKIKEKIESTSAAEGMNIIGYDDSGNKTTATNGGDALDEIYSNLTRSTARVPINLFEWREVAASPNFDVANAAGNGGLLASDTTPILRHTAGAGLNGQEISWAAANQDLIGCQLTLPEDIDGTADVLLKLVVYTAEVAVAGTDAATFTVETSWDGGALVTDTATDGTPAVTHHTITATIAAADVPNAPSYVSIALTPGAHANDDVQLVAAYLQYTRKLNP